MGTSGKLALSLLLLSMALVPLLATSASRDYDRQDTDSYHHKKHIDKDTGRNLLADVTPTDVPQQEVNAPATAMLSNGHGHDYGYYGKHKHGSHKEDYYQHGDDHGHYYKQRMEERRHHEYENKQRDNGYEHDDGYYGNKHGYQEDYYKHDDDHDHYYKHDMEERYEYDHKHGHEYKDYHKGYEHKSCYANTMTDPLNCGQCGQRCAAGLSCCSGACLDTTTDPLNCGQCGQRCAAGQSCCSGACLDTTTDPLNCGQCGNSCPDGACCSGTCANTTADPLNCGVCGNSCPGVACCSGSCANTTSNCGECGTGCPSGPTGCCLGTCTGEPICTYCIAPPDTFTVPNDSVTGTCPNFNTGACTDNIWSESNIVRRPSALVVDTTVLEDGNCVTSTAECPGDAFLFAYIDGVNQEVCANTLSTAPDAPVNLAFASIDVSKSYVFYIRADDVGGADACFTNMTASQTC